MRRTDDDPFVFGTERVEIWSKFALKMVLRTFSRLIHQLDCYVTCIELL